MNARTPRSLTRGLTLIEVCAVIAIGSILLGTAVPSFDGVMKKRQLEGAATEMLTDIHYARSEAVARNQGVRLSFLSAADSAQCVVVHTGAVADCTCGIGGVAQCSADAVILKAQSFPAGSRVTISANVTSMRVDPDRGTVTPAGTVRVTQDQGEVHHIVSLIGRIRSCSSGGQVNGYRAC